MRERKKMLQVLLQEGKGVDHVSYNPKSLRLQSQNGGVGPAEISVVEGAQVTEVDSHASPKTKSLEKNHEPVKDPNENLVKKPNEISIKEPNENPKEDATQGKRHMIESMEASTKPTTSSNIERRKRDCLRRPLYEIVKQEVESQGFDELGPTESPEGSSEVMVHEKQHHHSSSVATGGVIIGGLVSITRNHLHHNLIFENKVGRDDEEF
nr:agenet-like domain-containing protein [Tanacetum cinerariifolium]